MGGADKIFQKRKYRGPNSFKRSKNVREAYDVVLIICEGEKTEPHYIKELLSELKLSSANIKVVGLGTDPLTLVEYAVEEYNRTRDYDRIYCIFDKDKHTTYEQAKEKITLLQKRVKKSIPIYAITSVPCFEYWILLHYVDTASPYNGVGSKSAGDILLSEVKTHIGNYDKGQKNIYELTKSSLQIAISRAKRINLQNKKIDSDNPSTNMYELVEYLFNLKNKT
ncbi:RloB family protein [Legionella pneumophila serogroup 1]